MNLLDIFEIEQIPPHIKKSDLPPNMRSKLTMKDVEDERPKGAFRYRVGEKEFMNLDAAQQFAAGTNQPVQLINWANPSISEQDDPNSRARALGTANLAMLEKTRTTNQPVILDFGPGQPKYRISNVADKKWFLKTWEGYRNTGKGDKFVQLMGTVDGFENILDVFAAHHATQGAGGQQSSKYPPRQHNQKKTFEQHLGEKSQEDSPRVDRMVQSMRLKYPQARSDAEAMVYTVSDIQKRSEAEIEKLQRQADDIEDDLRKELEKKVGDLGVTRGRTGDALARIQNTTNKQQDIINKIIKIDQEQQQALDDLSATVKPGTARRGAAMPEPIAAPTTPAANRIPQAPMAPAPAVPAEPAAVSAAEPEPTDVRSKIQPTDNVRDISQARKDKKSKTQGSLFGRDGASADKIEKVGEGFGVRVQRRGINEECYQ